MFTCGKAGVSTFLALLTLGTLPIAGQAVFPESNGQSLSGVAAVDALAYSVTWLTVDGDRENFDRNLQSAFELGLRRDGIRVEEAAPNYLFCEIAVAQREELVSYSWTLTFYEWVPDGVYPLLWTAAGIVTVGSANFDADAAIEECRDRFVNEWLKWNPKRGADSASSSAGLVGR